MAKKVFNVFIFIAILWFITILNSIISYDLCQLGILPRTKSGLFGIVLAPFLHANFYHLISNTIPLFVLLLILYLFYNKQATLVVVISILAGGLGVWIFGRSAYHVGASGLIYSIAAFLIIIGFLKKDFKSLIISIIITFLYGGLIWGIFPGRFWISWEGHFFGAIAGGFMAYYLHKYKKDKV